ncbi:MAG TPA: hypothetical protein DCZ72_12025 [Armatimonadetes bacterium]|nr:hypothetical protein [Armatimonadota bacterium]
MRKLRTLSLILALAILAAMGLTSCGKPGGEPREALPVPAAHEAENQGTENEKGGPAPSKAPAPMQNYGAESGKGR